MKLPKELTTVTPLSKYLAMVVFITLPFVGFILGMRYQEMMNLAKRQQIEANLSIPRTPTPIAIPTTDPSTTANWISYDWKQITFKYPPNWSVEKIYYLTPSQHAQGESPENIGLKLFPGKEIKGSNLIQIGGRQINCDPPQIYTKCSYIPLVSEYIYTNSKNPELLSTFDLLIKTIKNKI